MSNAPRHTTDPDEPDRDLALAYVRGELTPDEHARFVERVPERRNPSVANPGLRACRTGCANTRSSCSRP